VSDAELIKKILAGDEERFGEVIDRYARRVWALCASYVHNPSDCEDLVQESFVRSYLRLNTIREPGAFGAWLGQIARTQCLEWLRKRSREKNAVANLEEAANEASAEDLASEAAQRDEMRAFLRQNLNALPDKYREALYLFYLGGHSVAEAARFLDISESAFKKRLQLGRDKLRDQIAGAIEEALGGERPHPGLEKTVLAVIPFGKAAWLAKGGLASGGTAAHIGLPASLAGLGWLGVVAALSALTVGGYAYYTQHGEPVARAETPTSSALADMSDPPDSSAGSANGGPARLAERPGAAHAQAPASGHLGESEEVPGRDSTAKPFVHWKWARNAAPAAGSKVSKALQNRIDIEFDGEHIRNILEFLSEYVVNIVVDVRAVPAPPVRGVSAQDYRALVWEHCPKAAPSYLTEGLVESVDLREVPLLTALEHLLYPLGLVYEVKPYGFFVTAPGRQQALAGLKDEETADDLAKMQEKLSEPVSIVFKYEHLSRILEFIGEYLRVNFVVDQSVVAPPVVAGTPLPLRVLQITEMPDGSKRALIQLQSQTPYWYEPGERFEDYQLVSISRDCGAVELFSERERCKYAVKVKEDDPGSPGTAPFPSPPPVTLPPDTNDIQQWLRDMEGKQYVTDGLVDHINLRNVKLRHALEALLVPLHLGYENEGDYVFVSSPELLASDSDRPDVEAEITAELRNALLGKVSLEFENIEAVKILEYLSDSSGANIALGSKYVEIRRPEGEPPELVILPAADWHVSSYRMGDVPLYAALDGLLRQYGLDFLLVNGKVLVGTPNELAGADRFKEDSWVVIKGQIKPEPAN